jgi:Helix-turn-helix domain
MARSGHPVTVLDYPPRMPSGFREMLRKDRIRNGFTYGQVAWRLGISVAEYRELEDGEGYPHFDTWQRMCDQSGARVLAGVPGGL